MTLPTVPLGTTDMQLTRVGFGAWAIGGSDWANGWGSQDDSDSVAAIRHAVDRGVNWIDTAAVYGLGHSEEVVGRAISDIADADRPFVFTKGGRMWDPSDRSASPFNTTHPDQLRQEVEDSLRRLGVERIDLYQMHWPAPELEVEEYWSVFADLKSQGKVRAIGVSNHTIAQLERAEAVAHVDSLQPPFSAINTAAADDGLLDWSADNGTGVIVYSPMGSGLLTGAFSRERVAALGADDWRSRSPMFTTDLERNLAVAEKLEVVAEKHGVTQASAAAAWTLGFRGVTAAIVGARTPEQIDGWIGAATLELDADDYAAVGAAIPRS